MPKQKAILHICEKGHSYLKTSNSKLCPLCEAAGKTGTNFLSVLAAPAKRALEHQHIKSLEQLSEYSENEIAHLHGIGPGSIFKLNRILSEAGLYFKQIKK